MDKLPIGVDINNIIDHLRVISWEASDVLIYYSNLIKDKNCKIQLIKNKINEDEIMLFIDKSLNDMNFKKKLKLNFEDIEIKNANELMWSHIENAK